MAVADAAEPSPPLSIMAIPDVEHIVPPPGSEYDLEANPASPRMFKRHKFLPHPRNESANGSHLGTPDSRRSSSGSQRYTTAPLSRCAQTENGSGSHVASHHTLRHQRRKLSGGELPPTPPAHSRTPSGSHSVVLSNPSPLQTPAQSSEDVQSKTSPSTPPNQRSPPTPEVTPPQPHVQSLALPSRPTLNHRIPSKSTTDSRTESFRTALESPEASDEEDSRSTVCPPSPSARTSQITVRQVNGGEHKLQNGVGLGLGVRPDFVEGPDDLTPRRKGEFNSFDGEWGSGSEVEQEWDDNLSRNVTVKKRRDRAHLNGQRHEVVDNRNVSPTNATKAVRTLPLQGRILTYDSRGPDRRSFTAPEAATAPAEVSTNGDARRLSGMSSKSTASTVVEAILVETPPRRHKTLRHVKRVDALRDSAWQSSISPLSSAPSLADNGTRRRRVNQSRELPRESYASNSTVNSISSRKARREVWKNGGVPVVVVPDRQSSNRSSSQERSLRSSSSQRSKRSHSITSVPLSLVAKHHDLTPYFDRPPRRGRRTSESDGSTPGDQRTIDFPPLVPRRTSSLSAPTSRNGSREASRHGSRAGSLTAESLKAHNDSLTAKSVAQIPIHASAGPQSGRTESSVPVVTVDSAPSYDQLKPKEHNGESQDNHRRTCDTLLGSPLLSTHATPFSQASVETNATAAEISQAMAVSIVPHQNSSVLMVNHRPSESSDGDRRSQGLERQEQPTITTTEVSGAYDEEPATPQAQRPLSLSYLDSPLRNPRAPPEPPVLAFIPATPSGLTPADERPRLLGNFYDETEPDEKPSRGLEMVRRALGKRRHSYGPSPSRDIRPGFLTRTLSLSKNIRKHTDEDAEIEQDDRAIYGGELRDESRLHPDWRPSHYPGFYGDDGDGVYDTDDGAEEEAIRYPPIDNRPRPPKRSLSERMKRTFAILPLQDYEDEYIHDSGPERRTIRRTPSGNLRVVKHRGSVGSLRKQKRRPSTAPDSRRPFFPRSFSLGKGRRGDRDSDTDSQSNGLRRTWSLTQSVQGIPRRFSEKRREKRSNELRQKISRPRDVRDGVDDVIRRDGLREAFRQPRGQ